MAIPGVLRFGTNGRRDADGFLKAPDCKATPPAADPAAEPCLPGGPRKAPGTVTGLAVAIEPYDPDIYVHLLGCISI